MLSNKNFIHHMGRPIRKLVDGKKYICTCKYLRLESIIEGGIMWTILRKQAMIRNQMNEFNLFELLHAYNMCKCVYYYSNFKCVVIHINVHNYT